MQQKGLWINKDTFIKFSDNGRQSLTQEIATRKGAIDFYSLGMYLPNPDPVLKKQGKDITVYTELLGDAYLGGCVDSRLSGVKSLEWGIDRGKARSRQAQLVEDFFKDIDMETLIEDIGNAWLYGYHVLEIIPQMVGKYILPTRIVGKPPEWFCFSDENELLLKNKEHRDGAPVDPNRFLLVRHKATYQNPYGMPVLSRCFWPATFKKGGLKFWLMFTEKYGGVFAVGKHPRGAGKEDVTALLDSLEQMIQDAVAAIPDDSSIELKEAAGKANSAAVYGGICEYCKTDISIAILGQNLTTEVKGGSFAATKSHMEVRQDITDGDKKLTEKTINAIVKWIYDMNFGTGDRPAFSMWQEEDVDKDQADRDKTLADTNQVKFTKKYFMKTYGFEEDDIEVVDKPAPVQPAQFAEKGGRPSFFLEQGILDQAIDNLSPDDLQAQAEGLLKPVIDLIDGCSDYNEAMDKLTEAFPKMDTRKLDELYRHAYFVAEAYGMAKAQQSPGS